MTSIEFQQYPDHLNPFGSDEEEDEDRNKSIKAQGHNIVEYPDYLDPFLENEDEANVINTSSLNDNAYDDSLNPFGDSVEVQNESVQKSNLEHNTDQACDRSLNASPTGNPFGESDEENTDQDHSQTRDVSVKVDRSIRFEDGTIDSDPPESLEPPKPLPRTKSLLKKELILKNKQMQQQLQSQAQQNSQDQITSLSSATSSTSSSSTTITNNTDTNATVGSFQRRKNKRNAPPVPVNFRRQVSGSLEAIEQELNNIGDMLTIIEREYNLCQNDLKASHNTDITQFATSQAKLIELIKRRNSIVRRQRELMYRKRELNLDQLHSDIEYELRMIGNKQISHRTADDDLKEKQLLKKLVEIVEEKSDIVENLNKDNSCDEQDIEEAFRRLNIKMLPGDEDEEKSKQKKQVAVAATVKSEDCDKKSSHKFSKIATLLPKGGTLKGTIKLKRKFRQHKKNDSPSVP